MQMRTIAIFALLATAATSVAIGQQAAGNFSSAAKVPAGLSFAFDATHGQMSVSGVTVKANPMSTAPTAPTPVTGTVKITLNIDLVSKFPKGTRIKCGALVAGGMIDTSTLTIEGGLETAATKAWGERSGTAVCTLKVPYAWTIPTPDGAALIVAFGAAAVDEDGDVRRSTVQLGGVGLLPATGTTTALAFDAAL